MTSNSIHSAGGSAVLSAANGGTLLHDLEHWTVRLAGLSWYSMSKALFASMKATPTPRLPPAPEPESDLTLACEVRPARHIVVGTHHYAVVE